MSHPVEQALWRVPGQGRPLPPVVTLDSLSYFRPAARERVLFVGGPKDGEWEYDTFDAPVWHVFAGPPGRQAKNVYRRAYVGDFRVYVIAGADPFARLLAGYKPEKPDARG